MCIDIFVYGYFRNLNKIHSISHKYKQTPSNTDGICRFSRKIAPDGAEMSSIGRSNKNGPVPQEGAEPQYSGYSEIT